MMTPSPHPLKLTSIYEADALLEQWHGRRARCSAMELLVLEPGETVYHLHLGAAPFDVILKIAPLNTGMLAQQANAHKFVRLMSDFPCPDVYHADTSGASVPYAFLLLEFIPGTRLDALLLSAHQKERIDRELAHLLLNLHANKRETFGCIDGSNAASRWADIMSGRLNALRQQLAGVLPSQTLEGIDRILPALPVVFADQGVPTLVHGNLRSTNIVAVESSGDWHVSGVRDAGAQYADVEMELAQLEVFQTVGPVFFSTYYAKTPARPGYELRRLLYHLNTQMLQVLLYGEPTYIEKVAQLGQEIARRL